MNIKCLVLSPNRLRRAGTRMMQSAALALLVTLTMPAGAADARAVKSTGLMTVEAADDRIAAPGQTRAAHDLLPFIPPAKRNHLLVPASGHFSLFHGASCRTRVVPEIIAFIDRIA